MNSRGAQMVIDQLVFRGVSDPRLLGVMASLPRERFVPERLRRRAYEDGALPIGFGQTISQPYMVAYMTEVLELDGSERVLEIGTGCGYQAAVLASLAREVITVERVAELAACARATLDDLGFSQVEILVRDGSRGVPARAPFDAILVAAAAPEVPGELIEQLAPGGRLVVPVGSHALQSLEHIRRGVDGTISRETRGGCIFVPLVGERGFSQ